MSAAVFCCCVRRPNALCDFATNFGAHPFSLSHPTHRRADSLRRSLADTFAAGGGSAADAPAAAPPPAALLTEAELEGILEVSLRLAAENKISDRNVWALPLIDALPELIRHEQALRGAAGGFNFQKMSGGLDAGVQIYSKRVDQTWKAAFCSLRDLKPSGGGGEDGACVRVCVRVRGCGGGDVLAHRLPLRAF